MYMHLACRCLMKIPQIIVELLSRQTDGHDVFIKELRYLTIESLNPPVLITKGMKKIARDGKDGRFLLKVTLVALWFDSKPMIYFFRNANKMND